MKRECPICGEKEERDEAAFAHHVNAHLDEGEDPLHLTKEDHASRLATSVKPSSSLKRDRPNGSSEEQITCFVCDYPFGHLAPSEREIHVNDCLDGGALNGSDLDIEHEVNNDRDYVYNDEAPRRNGQSNDDNHVQAEWDGPIVPGSAWADWVGKKVDRGDGWWDPTTNPIRSSEIPSNFSPGIIPILALILKSAITQNLTRSAVLCRETTHIKGVWGFDIGWGCGYRNALMAISPLIASKDEYRAVFDRDANGAEPGVRRIQGWIEEGWQAGFDEDGREQLKGRVLGTRKWIGSSDLYAFFTFKGVPCELYDFPKPTNSKGPRTAHIALQQWVKDYFAQDLPVNAHERSPSTKKQDSAYDRLMRTSDGGQGRGEAVRISSKYPLILQHSGHSRTIVGYEENGNGSINLLLFDPGRTMPKDLRAAGIAHLSETQPARPKLPTSASKLPSKASHESISFSRPYHGGQSQRVNLPSECGTMRGGGRVLDDDEEMDNDGWVRKKAAKVLHRKDQEEKKPWEGPVGKALGYFRVNLGTLSSHTEYQILAFTGGPLLSQSERERRKRLTSHVIR